MGNVNQCDYKLTRNIVYVNCTMIATYLHAGLPQTWYFDHERYPGGQLKVGLFGPLGMLTQLPAVVRAEHDHGAVSETERLQPGQDGADHLVDVGHRGVVCPAELQGFRVW